MSSFSTLRRFSLFTQQRFRNLHSSSISQSSSSSSSNPHSNPKWGSAIVVASALALFYCFNTPNSHFEFSNNAPRSSSPPLFEKSSLPESTHDHLLFGGKYFQIIYPFPRFFFLKFIYSWHTLCSVADAYRSKVFFNYEKRLRLHSPPEKVFNLC